MKKNRREFVLNSLLGICGLSLLPINVLKTDKTPFIVKYQVSGNSDEVITKFLKMQDELGVKANNLKLKSQGLIISKSTYTRISDSFWESTLVFKSRDSFEEFLNSSKTIVAKLEEFKIKHSIKVKFQKIS